MTMVFRAGTWNIHEGIPASGGNQDWHADLIGVIAGADLDVLALQEVPFDKTGRSALLGIITRRTMLAHASGFPLSPSSFSRRDRSGVAVVSRLPHTVLGRMRLPNPNLHSKRPGRSWVSWDKGMLVIELRFAKSPLWASSVHCYPFHDFGRNAADQEFKPIWQALAGTINDLPAGRMIIAGDFNTERRDLLTNLVKGRNLIPAIVGTATHDGRAVDDILHDPYLVRRSFAVSPSLSDHAFCEAEFVLGKDAQ